MLFFRSVLLFVLAVLIFGTKFGSEFEYSTEDNRLYLNLFTDNGVDKNILQEATWPESMLRRPFHLLRDIQKVLMYKKDSETLKAWIEHITLLLGAIKSLKELHPHFSPFRAFLKDYVLGVFLQLQHQMIREKIDYQNSSMYILEEMSLDYFHPQSISNLSVILEIPMSSYLELDKNITTSLSTIFPVSKLFPSDILNWLELFREEILFSTSEVASPIQILLFHYSGSPLSINIDISEEDLIAFRRHFFDQQCQYLTEYMYSSVSDSAGVFIQCAFLEAPIVSDRIVDVREIAGRYAYDTWNTDFYLWADINFPFAAPGWTSRIIWHMKRPMHMNKQECTVMFPAYVRGEHPTTGTPLNHPVSPLLSRAFFQIFLPPHTSSISKNELLLSNAPSIWNNVLLADVFHGFQATCFLVRSPYDVSHGQESVFEIPTDQALSRLFEELSFFPVASVLEATKARKRVWHWYNQHVYPQHPYPDLPSMLDNLRTVDFLHPYCHLTTNLCPTENVAEEKNGSSNLFWEETLILPWSFICKFSGVHARLWSSIVGDISKMSHHCNTTIAMKTSNDTAETVYINGSISHTFRVHYPSPLHKSASSPAKVAVITAMFGDYELTGKPFPRQKIPTDFILFTDRPYDEVHAPGWIVVNIPYHVLQYVDEVENEEKQRYHNAFHRHTHPFNIAKFYKQSFHRIPMLRDYDVVIWIDGTVVITDPMMSHRMYEILFSEKKWRYSNEHNQKQEEDEKHVMIVFQHHRQGDLFQEVNASVHIAMHKYDSEFWAGYPSLRQNITAQYHAYVEQGYPSFTKWFDNRETRQEYGVWCTCFVAWNMHHRKTTAILDEWYRHTQLYTTQDQISFPFVVDRLHVVPHSLPDGSNDIYGTFSANTMFFKYFHGF